MTPRIDSAQLYTDRSASYSRFVRSLRYPQGIRGHFLESPLLRSGLRVLDAGCGSGIVTFALREALLDRGFSPGPLHGFDLTAAMLERFRETLRDRAIEGVSVVQADVLELDALPESWSDYDLVVSASMLEYLPRNDLVVALASLRARLSKEGSFILFISRRNWLTRPLIGRWWSANLYQAAELEDAFRRAGFSTIAFRKFPLWFRYLALWGYIVEARR